jgi:hypothetical protein
MKKTLLIILLCFLTINIQGQSKKESILETIEGSYDRAPNTANLAKYLNKLKSDIKNISKSFKSLRWAVSNNNRSNKKKHAQAIKNKTEDEPQAARHMTLQVKLPFVPNTLTQSLA